VPRDKATTVDPVTIRRIAYHEKIVNQACQDAISAKPQRQGGRNSVAKRRAPTVPSPVTLSECWYVRIIHAGGAVFVANIEPFRGD